MAFACPPAYHLFAEIALRLFNYNRIKAEAKQIVDDEIRRIEDDDDLKHLLQKKDNN